MGFFEVSGGEAGFGMNAGDAHEVGVGADAADALNGRSADGDDGVLEELAADEDDFDAGVLNEFNGDGGAVRDNRGTEIGHKMARDLNGCGPAIEDDDLTGANHGGSGPADDLLLVSCDVEAEGEIAQGRRRRKRAAVDALEEAFCGEFTEVAADGVFGDVQLVAQVFGDDGAGFAKGFEDMFAAVAGEHSSTIAQFRGVCTKLHEIVYLCTNEVRWLLGGRMNMTKPLIVLVAGPYRSGTDGDPKRIRQNLQRLESFALDVYKAGHIPLIGEWVALPLAEQAGSSEVGDAISEQYLYPVAARLLARCDAVLRIEGLSKGADEDVRIARERGLPVYFRLEDVPVASPVEELAL